MSVLSHFSAVARSVRVLLVAALLAPLLSLAPAPSLAGAQDPVLQTLEVWGLDSGIVPSPKDWLYRQSTAIDDLGSASAADPALDDSGWVTKTLRWREIVGSNNANHFRKDFDLAAIGIEPFQVVGIRVRLQYDDTAVMYLNGTEVYRSIRGNLDPDYVAHPVSTDIPHNVNVPWGGGELDYVNIPDPDMVNICELPDEACSASPYGSAQPPEIPVDLLVGGVNTWSVTTWNNSAGGSGDSSLDHVFELLIDESALPPAEVFINEVMASNSGSYEVELDGDPTPETPDWIELRNIDTNNSTDIGGWTISDSSASWTIPAGTIVPAGGYLILAANDGDDPTTSPMQTNFKLSSGGDSVRLTTIDGVLANEFQWTDQFADNSFGLVANEGDPTYLASPTPGASNDVLALSSAPPILRLFRDRMYNPGEVVDLQIDAFDPDGDALTYSVAPLPAGVLLDASTGALTGTADFTGEVVTRITVSDNDGDTDFQDMTWTSVGAPAVAASPIVLNEYNAVPADGELNNGSLVGNGGDWFEFLVVEDNVDLRGYTIEFRQRDADTDLLRDQVFLTFADRAEFGRVPAGTLITIAESFGADDLSFDAVDDWSINLQVDPVGAGVFFEAPAFEGSFNSTRRDQTVLIRNAAGELVTPLAGETDGWDAVAGGVSGGEVMNLCRDLTQGDVLSPTQDYKDNGSVSTAGEPNVCVFPNPLDPAQLITEAQDLAPLRASANFGAGTGDVNCDLVSNVVDALLIAQYEVGNAVDAGPCLFGGAAAASELAVVAGDFNNDGVVNIVDALVITRCEVGLPTPSCP